MCFFSFFQKFLFFIFLDKYTSYYIFFFNFIKFFFVKQYIPLVQKTIHMTAKDPYKTMD